MPVLAPASLSVTVATVQNSSAPLQIQTLNLTRTRRKLAVEQPDNADYTVNFVEINGIGAAGDGYTKPSARTYGLVYSTVQGGRIISSPSPCSGNCTFNQTFFGPAYYCDEIDFTKSSVPGDPFGTGSQAAQFWGSDVSTAWNVQWYMARNASGACSPDEPACAIIGSESDPTLNGWASGTIWIAYQWVQPSARNASFVGIVPDADWERHHLLCTSYNASYAIQRSYVNGIETVSGTYTYLNALNYSTATFEGNLDDMQPEYAGYAIHQILYSILYGSIGLNGRSQPIDTTQLRGTQLVEPVPFPLLNASMFPYSNDPGSLGIQKPVRNLAAKLAELHFNITVGMLSIPNLIYLQNETVLANISTTQTQWTYNPTPLAATYGGFFVAGLVIVVLAVAAILGNDGVGVDNNGFLRALMTTRNVEFDAAVAHAGAGRGEDYMQEVLRDTEVQFGRLQSGGAVGFGKVGWVEKLT
jgi:hypothetical protein